MPRCHICISSQQPSYVHGSTVLESFLALRPAFQPRKLGEKGNPEKTQAKGRSRS